MHIRKSNICSNKLDLQETNSVSHSSTESEIISLDTRLRLEVACSGIMGSNRFCSWKCFSCFRWIGATWFGVHKHHKSQKKINVVENIDSIPSNVQFSRQEA